MKIELLGDEEARQVFATLVPKVQELALAKLAQAVYEDVETSVKKHTGLTKKLFQSLRKQRVGDAWYIYHDQNFAPYAKYVLLGTQPHIIKPKNVSALRWPSGPGFMFAKFVRHPGYKGDPYMLNAIKRAPSKFEAIVKSLQNSV
jgi:hypothetical protein